MEWEQKFQRISEMIDGFSGREIAKLAVAWQVCCMAGMLDTFSSNVTCGNILQCVLCKILDNSCKHTT